MTPRPIYNRLPLPTASSPLADLPWAVGSNFLPSTAINQLEMWQEATFDEPTIARELDWAQQLGFRLLRIYLHDLLWATERNGFLARIDRVLAMAECRGMGVVLVLFDDCHRPDPVPGPQPLPVRGVHNSGWKQSPGRAVVRQLFSGELQASERKRLRDYVCGVLAHFSKDPRIVFWDLYNEPGQSGSGDESLPLLKAVWEWAGEVAPSQPLTSCLDGSVGEANMAFSASQSDVITFHCYDATLLEPTIERLKSAYPNRSLLCTEFMAREHGTTFAFSLPIFQRHRVSCLCWGLVAGKSQTHFNWKTVESLKERIAAEDYLQPGDPLPEPPLWFHDILRADGSAFDPAEVEFLRHALVANR